MTENPPLRTIKSFIRRDGRLTIAQARAFEESMARFGIALQDRPIDWDALFGRKAPRILEIGFGNGLTLAKAASQFPDKDFIGIETHKPGVGQLLQSIEKNALTNIRIFYADAVDVLKQCVADHTFNTIQLFFPDPWPKRKHHKRRIIQPAFVELLKNKLTLEGILYLATDWEDYAHHMLKVLSQTAGLINTEGVGKFAKSTPFRPLITKFEQRGMDAGRQIFELCFQHSQK